MAPDHASRVDYTCVADTSSCSHPWHRLSHGPSAADRRDLRSERQLVRRRTTVGLHLWRTATAGDERASLRRSPAWHSWVGQAASLDLLTDLGAAALHEHALGLANEFRTLVGQPISDSAIVSVDVVGNVAATLSTARIRASTRNGRLRLAFHVNNTDDDVKRAADALRKHVVG